MTRSNPTPAAGRRPARPETPDRWALQDAKARFSEVFRRARHHGPQHVTLHGRDGVVIISVEDFQRLSGNRSGETLVAAMQASPWPEIDLAPDLAPDRATMPVRDIAL
jgi:prevent-host-death family protein